MLTWGAAREEVAGDYAAGKEIILGSDGWATMAKTLPASPERVWRWLVQMGAAAAGGTAGTGWTTTENPARAASCLSGSAWRRASIFPVLPWRGEGRGGSRWAALEPNRTLVLRSSCGLFSGRSFFRDPVPLPRRGWTGSGDSIFGPEQEGRPVWWSVP
jgi:hypothetical protein